VVQAQGKEHGASAALYIAELDRFFRERIVAAPAGGNAHLLPLPLSPFYVLQSFAPAGSWNKVVGGYGVVNHAAAAKKAQQYAQQQ
jgi:hypothetical protein